MKGKNTVICMFVDRAWKKGERTHSSEIQMRNFIVYQGKRWSSLLDGWIEAQHYIIIVRLSFNLDDRINSVMSALSRICFVDISVYGKKKKINILYPRCKFNIYYDISLFYFYCLEDIWWLHLSMAWSLNLLLLYMYSVYPFLNLMPFLGCHLPFCEPCLVICFLDFLLWRS